jgi:lipoprotein-releasing system permease protein
VILNRAERMLARRYLLPEKGEKFIFVVAGFSVGAVALGVAALIIVMSVMNGFRAELLGRILGFQGHVFVQGAVLDEPERSLAVARMSRVKGVVQVTPIVQGQVLAMGPTQISGAIIRGISARDLAATKLVSGNITGGSIRGFGRGEYGGEEIVVGERLAEALGVRPGENLTLVSPAGGATAFGGTPLQKVYVVAATFSIGMSQYDQAYIYMPLEQAQLFLGREDSVDEIEVKLANPDHAQRLRGALQKAAGPAAFVTDWAQRDTSFWGALKVERNVMRLILMLLVAIAAMNIISGLVMLVKNKGRDIAILRTMGAGQGAIMRIFIMSGAAVGALGTLAGLLIGSLFCIYIGEIQTLVEYVTGQKVFSSDVYYLSRIPAKVDWREVSIITLFALGMSLLATLPPSWRASRLDPVEALRYE